MSSATLNQAAPDTAPVSTPTERPSSAMPHVSIIIPVRDDAVRLRRCLVSVFENAYPREGFEVIVADNGSRDGSRDVAAELGARVCPLPDRPVAQVRNEAAGQARASLLAFVDADHTIDRQWIASALDTLSAPDVAAVGAPYLPPPDATWVQRAYDRFRRRASGVEPVSWLGSGNLVIRREVFERLRGFDESLETCEDVDLCNRLRAAGYRLLSDDRLRSIHFGDPKSLRAVFLGELWRGRDNLRVTLRGPFDLGALPSLLLPMATLGLAAAALAGVVLASRGGLWLTLGALAGIGAIAGLRAARMSAQSGRDWLRDLPANLAVATVYEGARALALVTRMSHKVRRRRD